MSSKQSVLASLQGKVVPRLTLFNAPTTTPSVPAFIAGASALLEVLSWLVQLV